jgi:DNA-binding protein HU-beta
MALPKKSAVPAKKAAPAKKGAPAKKAAPAKGGAASKASGTVTLRNISAYLAETHGMPKKQTETLLTDMVDTMVDHLKRGDRIRIGGFGILQVRSRPARMGRNPATGEQIQIKASKKVAFRPAKELKEAV